MLVDVFPRHVIEFIGIHGTEAVPEAIAQLAHRHSGVSILFMDIVGFTPVSSEADPQDIMRMLNELFSGFDAFCTEHGVYKVWLRPRIQVSHCFHVPPVMQFMLEESDRISM